MWVVGSAVAPSSVLYRVDRHPKVEVSREVEGDDLEEHVDAPKLASHTHQKAEAMACQGGTGGKGQGGFPNEGAEGTVAVDGIGNGGFEALKEQVKQLKAKVGRMEALVAEYEKIEQMEKEHSDERGSSGEEIEQLERNGNELDVDATASTTMLEILKTIENDRENEVQVIQALERLAQIRVNLDIMIGSGCGKTVRSLRKDGRPQVAAAATRLVNQWREEFAKLPKSNEGAHLAAEEQKKESKGLSLPNSASEGALSSLAKTRSQEPDEEKINRARLRMAKAEKEYLDRRNSRVSKVIGIDEAIVSQQGGKAGSKAKAGNLNAKRSNGMTKVMNALKRVKR